VSIELSQSTIEPLSAGKSITGIKVPALTVVFHPDLRRIGDVARLPELLGKHGCCEVSRLAPVFATPAGTDTGPLGDRHVSRKPLTLAGDGTGVVRARATSELAVRVDGSSLDDRTLGPADLARGVVIELGDRVVVLLHMLGLPRPRQPAWGFCGDSDALERVREAISRVADLPVPVLVRGESGTGKELVARAIASSAPWRAKPFIAVNMAAVPHSVAASELFGHTAGAFTGAHSAHPGFFAQADGGTLFLDEIGELEAETQAMLLRALETGEVWPLGGARPLTVEVRVVAATDSDLEVRANNGEFRSSLLHRLSGYVVEVPPLRQRRDDIGRLLVHFLARELEATGERHRLEEASRGAAWLPAQVVATLARYDWPGNIRQLLNVTRHLVLSTRGGGVVTMDTLPSALLTRTAESGDAPERRPETATPSAPVDEDRLLAALRESGWRTSATARALGISRTTLYALIEKSARIRQAKDVGPEELRRCRDECAGDVDAMAEKLEVSGRAIKLRMRQLGM
jgi:two-component system nitrogen regulation response regulator GlnG